jgi:hypothetical protein
MRRISGLVVLAVLVASCGEHRLVPAPAPALPHATIVVTVGYGARVTHAASVAPGQSVVAALEGTARVDTTYGGQFVQAIDGLQGSASDQRDWLFFLNGVESDVGAAAVTLRAGDQAWWDYRDWGGGKLHVPVVVGAWPDPFLHAATVAADPPLAAALKRLGARLGGSSPFRVLVGADADLRARDADWRRAASDPATAGLTASIDDHDVVRAWSASRRSDVPVPGGAAVAVATSTADGGALLVVTGTTRAAALAAATSIAGRPALLAHRYAVVFDASGRVLAYGGDP